MRVSHFQFAAMVGGVLLVQKENTQTIVPTPVSDTISTPSTTPVIPSVKPSIIGGEREDFDDNQDDFDD